MDCCSLQPLVFPESLDKWLRIITPSRWFLGITSFCPQFSCVIGVRLPRDSLIETLPYLQTSEDVQTKHFRDLG